MLNTKFFIVLFLLVCFVSQAQVGVGTVNPQADLDVNGTTLIQSELQLGALDYVQPEDENFKLLSRVENSVPAGKIAVLDVDKLKVAPVNVINYRFTNIKLDNLKNVNLNYDASKYIVGISNFRYVGAPIKKKESGGKISVGNFVTRTFIENNTWHLEIRNRYLDLDSDQSLEYYVSLVIYDKSYYRNLPEIVTDLNGANSGKAAQIPNLY